MNVKCTRRKNQVVNIFEQQEMLAKAEEIRNCLKASTWHELETNGKFNKNDKLTFISAALDLLNEYSYKQVEQMTGISKSTLIRAKRK